MAVRGYHRIVLLMVLVAIMGILGFLVRDVASLFAYSRVLVFVFLAGWILARVIAGAHDRSFVVSLLFLAVFIRILVSLFFFVISPPGENFYLFGNARKFDTAAWIFASEGRDAPLPYAGVSNFMGFVYALEYMYRLFSVDAQRIFIPLILIATIAGCAAPFLYRFVSLVFKDQRLAKLSGFVMAFHPVFIFHAATQIRESFIMTALAITLYGFAFVGKQQMRGLLASIFGISMAFLLNPVYGFPLLLLWVVLVFSKIKNKVKAALWGGGIVMILLGAVLSSSLLKIEYVNTRSLLTGEYIYNKILARQVDQEGQQTDEGLAKDIFVRLPYVVSAPLQIGWGVSRPWIAQGMYDLVNGRPQLGFGWSLRSLGWNLTLPFLLYGIGAAIKYRRESRTLFWLAFISIGVIMVPLLAQWADQWDYPRYRSIGAPLYATLIAFGWLHGMRVKSLAVRYLIGLVTLTNGLLIPLYAFRLGKMWELVAVIIQGEWSRVPVAVAHTLVFDGLPMLVGLLYVMFNMYLIRKYFTPTYERTHLALPA